VRVSFLTLMASAGALVGCAAQPTNYDRAVAGYKACLAAASPSSPSACDGQRHIMESAAQVAATPNISQESNVYVSRQ
jgi:hypothetical protein